MKPKEIVTRFPPSPTGYLHIGGARTALFNWLFARQCDGTFILRIEDTDRARSSKDAANAIIRSMEWLGLDWDRGPFFQSERYDIYNTFIERLLSSDQAYHCHCTPEELEKRRNVLKKMGLKPKYDGKCRKLGLKPSPGSVVRLKAPQTGVTQFDDLVKGVIRFNNEELDDLVMRRADGSPTYHLAVVADDIDLGITHVIRGDDHVNNTPRQILIYQAIGEPTPHYAHVPMILGPDKTRLSKRHGAMSVLEYKEMGYLPHALLNALVRLGWSYGDQEKFTIEELIAKFSLRNVGKAAGVFNGEKLMDLNAQYIRESKDEYLAQELIPFIRKIGFDRVDKGLLRKAIVTLKPRSKTLVEMAQGASFYFQDEISYDRKADEKFLKPELLGPLEDIKKRLEKTDKFDQAHLEEVFRVFLQERAMKIREIAQPVRVALTGKTASPGLFESMEVLGKKRVIDRFHQAISHIKAKG
jgi:glutamyl-tRNA synthetase